MKIATPKYRASKIVFLLLILSFLNSCSTQTPVSPESQHKTKVWILEHNPQLEHPSFNNLFNDLLSRLSIGYRNLGLKLPTEVKFYVIESDKVGVFSLCDGSIFISSGTIKKLTSAHQLACLLAHDISHISLKHACSFENDPMALNDFEIEADAAALKILASSSIDPLELRNVYLSIYRSSEMDSPNNFEKLDERRLDAMESLLKKIPEIPTKIPEERLFRKVQHLLKNKN